MSVLIIGGGVCGLGAALLLARDGHEVTVLERDEGRRTQPLSGFSLGVCRLVS
jgi:phytoene dehydrogenase-like protein